MRKSELKGKKVTLIRMEDPYTKLRPGSKGTIEGEDDLGHILVRWDDGSGLSLIPEVDEYSIQESLINEDLDDSDMDYVTTKCQELVELFENGYNTVVGVDIMSNSVKFNFGVVSDVYLFIIDFDSKIMYMMLTYGEVGSPEDVHKDEEWEFDTIDEAFEILEKEIHKALRMSENKTYNMKHLKRFTWTRF